MNKIKWFLSLIFSGIVWLFEKVFGLLSSIAEGFNNVITKTGEGLQTREFLSVWLFIMVFLVGPLAIPHENVNFWHLVILFSFVLFMLAIIHYAALIAIEKIKDIKIPDNSKIQYFRSNLLFLIAFLIVYDPVIFAGLEDDLINAITIVALALVLQPNRK